MFISIFIPVFFCHQCCDPEAAAGAASAAVAAVAAAASAAAGAAAASNELQLQLWRVLHFGLLWNLL